MRTSNGNFLDEDGNVVNVVELLKTGKATPVVNGNNGGRMNAHSGWFTDENGTPVNIIALIDAALSASSTKMSILPVDTASGAIATFNDGADDIPVKKLTVNIKPIQDLHGYDNPWPAGGGINNWDEEWEQGQITNGANSTNTAGFRSKNKIKINPNTTYYLHVGSGDYGNFWVSYYDENEVYIPTFNASGYSTLEKNREFTTPENAYYMRFFLSVATEYKNDISINYPSTNTDYYPYSNVCPISGWTGVSVTRVENNLWDEEWELGSYDTTTGEATTYTDRIRGKNRINVVPNTEYFFKTRNGITAGNMYFYDKDDVFISARATRGNTAQVIPDNCRYMRIAMGLPYGVTYNNDVSINYPSSDHEYHSYVGTNVNIDWTNEAGEVFGGTLDALSGVLTVDRVIVDLGTLNWMSTYVQSYSVLIAKTNKAGVNSKKTLCSAYLYSGLSVGANRPDKTINMGVPYFDSQKTTVSVKDTSYSDATVFKKAMSGVQLVYELADPITYQLTPNEVKTILGENIIFANTGDVSVEYRADIKKYIDKVVATAVSALS